MIQKTIEKIEASLQQMQSVDPKRKTEIIRLLGTLKTEVEALSSTHQKQAESIASQLDTLSSKGLTASVQGFEATHPRLVQTINELCEMLAGIGI